VGWGTERLTELIVALGGVADPAAAAQRGVEGTAEALEAEVVALVRDDEVVASFGWPRIEVPERELIAIARAGGGDVPLPGRRPHPAVAVALDDRRGGCLIIARAGDPLDEVELTLLRGLARALAQALLLLGAVEAERALRVRSEQQARDNARLLSMHRERQRLLEALGTIQRSISHRAPLQDILRAIVGTAGELLHDPDADLLVGLPDGADVDVVVARAMAENRLVVVERVGAAMAAPVHEQGEVIGALIVTSDEPQRTYSRSEQGILLALAEHASLALTDAKTVGAMVHQALHDSLTGLPNRALFLDRLAHALSRRGSGGGGEVSVLFCDLDRFKTINDSLGHEAGDELLVAVARRILACLRGSDTAARLGGDEFVVLLEDVQSTAEAVAVADRITEAFRTPFAIVGREVYVSASIGIVRGSTDAEELLRNADVAMYRAKAEGSGRSAVFEPSMRAEVLDRLELEADLRRAQERGELEVHYQPIVALVDGELAGFEALARWRHPERGLVPPPAFIPVAEESDLIHELGRFVLETACRDAARWDIGSITVNLSGRQLERADLVQQVADVLVATGLPAGRLVLEITETVLMHDSETTIDRLAALKALGVRLAVDDFGTGYSSLRYLSRFPIDLLKMAKPFVDGVGTEQGAALARTIVDLGASLGLAIVAEGIEQGVQLAQLRRLGCQYGQGYLFARPLAVGQADALRESLLADSAAALYPMGG
jgi:diguanylate cyclase (GGDEF)-like protein